MRLESSKDMGDPREISCSRATVELGGAGGSNTNNRYFSISGTDKQTRADRVDEQRSPRDHFGGHGRYQVPEVPQESSVEGQTIKEPAET